MMMVVVVATLPELVLQMMDWEWLQGVDLFCGPVSVSWWGFPYLVFNVVICIVIILVKWSSIDKFCFCCGAAKSLEHFS